MSDVKCPKDMVYIPAGIFSLGSTNGVYDEQPVYNVFLSDFCMDKHEVTNAEYRRYRNADPKERPSPSGFNEPDQPVVFIDWNEAKAFCEDEGNRLPTEAEWEKAAKGPSGLEYITESLWLYRNEAHYGVDGTVDVCSHAENGYGLCDMWGNVSEWVSDDAYESGKSRHPQGPSDGDCMVHRGGSWGLHPSPPWFLSARERECDLPCCDNLSTGFRCASAPHPQEVCVSASAALSIYDPLSVYGPPNFLNLIYSNPQCVFVHEDSKE